MYSDDIVMRYEGLFVVEDGLGFEFSESGLSDPANRQKQILRYAYPISLARNGAPSYSAQDDTQQ